ncbi:hypothetical protein SAMN04488513_11095 [Pseudozobellia thermophila]|uniref:Por secretion system C-terminal sorting domain-containing protein n=2 Tax=Pseudozobellia thermophila TaxID=192903 RepID=A0A1M6MQ63_9FLAO|nr:hypothetical protein SAMN04488513_11095 [Pseudozobellia thermophila]
MIALMFGTMTASANEGKLSLVTTENTKSVVFELDADAGKTTIKLLDKDSNVIYFENVEKEAYVKKFDLQNLKDGQYYFLTDDALRTTTYVINVKGSKVAILDKKEDTKPVYRSKDGVIYLNHLNLDKSKVNVNVFDSSDRLVFSQEWKDTMVVEKVFNFKNAFKDTYTLVLSDGDKSYYETINVK